MREKNNKPDQNHSTGVYDKALTIVIRSIQPFLRKVQFTALCSFLIKNVVLSMLL